MKWIYRALEEYDLQNMNLRMVNKDGDVFIVSTPAGEQLFLKIIFSNDGRDYLKDENIYHSWSQLCVEMELLAGLEKISFGTAGPVKNIHNEYVSRLGHEEDVEIFATLTTFVDGTLMEEAHDDPLEMAYAAGVAAGKLHNASQNGLSSIAVNRPHRKQPYIQRVMDTISQGVTAYRTVTQEQFSIFQQGSEWILSCMGELDVDTQRNVGLVHTDLRAGNFLYRPGVAIPIDFTRSVYGYYLYDLGEMCAHMGRMAPNGEAQKQILLGYHSVRPFRKGEVLKVQSFFVMFLLMLAAECIDEKENPWLMDTSKSLSEIYIPGLFRGGHFSGNVRNAIQEIE